MSYGLITTSKKNNYDIEKEYYDKISANYLSTVLLNTAGIPLTGYQKYLRDLMISVPVICAGGYSDSNGVFCSFGDASGLPSILRDYQILNYNNLFDTGNRITRFFTLV